MMVGSRPAQGRGVFEEVKRVPHIRGLVHSRAQIVEKGIKQVVVIHVSLRENDQTAHRFANALLVGVSSLQFLGTKIPSSVGQAIAKEGQRSV